MSDQNRPPVNLGDAELVQRIDTLVEEEHRLEREHAGEGLDVHDLPSLRELARHLAPADGLASGHGEDPPRE